MTKVILFGRQDIAAVWSGDFRYASLIVAHLDAFFTASAPMRGRDVDVSNAFNKAVGPVNEHLQKSVQAVTPSWERNRLAQTPDPTAVIVGGYSIRHGEFRTLTIAWLKGRDRWHVSTNVLADDAVLLIGDERRRARMWMKAARTRRDPEAVTWRMEPLGAIHRATIDRQLRTRSIGGMPQLAKVFMHGAAAAYGFIDPLTGDVWSRACRVSTRTARDIAFSGRLIDLSTWLVDKGQYANLNRI